MRCFCGEPAVCSYGERLGVVVWVCCADHLVSWLVRNGRIEFVGAVVPGTTRNHPEPQVAP